MTFGEDYYYIFLFFQNRFCMVLTFLRTFLKFTVSQQNKAEGVSLLQKGKKGNKEEKREHRHRHVARRAPGGGARLRTTHSAPEPCLTQTTVQALAQAQ
jgi:hypothetical protein